MSRTRFRVNLHSIIAWMSRNYLLAKWSSCVLSTYLYGAFDSSIIWPVWPMPNFAKAKVKLKKLWSYYICSLYLPDRQFFFTVNPSLGLATAQIASRALVKLLISTLRYITKNWKNFFRQNLIRFFSSKFKSDALNPLFPSYNTTVKCCGYCCTPPPIGLSMFLKWKSIFNRYVVKAACIRGVEN